MPKTQLSPSTLQALICQHVAPDLTQFRQLSEGLESQAFAFTTGSGRYVVRVSTSAMSFAKDAYADQHFRTAQLPIPRVITIGQFDAQHAYCISEEMPGVTLQGLSREALQPLLQPTLDTWRALQQIDIGATTGYGWFDASGNGQHRSWHTFLLSILDPARYAWPDVLSQEQHTFFATASRLLSSLAACCPNERSLVHGDFGSNNVLTDGRTITAVLDWADALYGDPLFDIATAFFWRSWLVCMEEQAAHYDAQLRDLPGYRERQTCYQLWIGLRSWFHSAQAHEQHMIDWTIERCRQIVAQHNDRP